MRRGAKAYFAANIVSQASALTRYVILARLLGPEELGLAAMVILTAQFFESISDTGSDRFLIQDKDGDSPSLQGLTHLVLAVRGALIAGALILSAGLLSGLYGEPSLQVSLVALGVAPLLGGLIHLDLRRVQRHADFRPESLAMIVSECASLAATAIAAALTRDHMAIIYGLIVRAACLVVVSHVTATRPYRWGFDKIEGRRFATFAMPLALNGLLLFLGQQGDRLIVGSGLGAEALGHYSAVLLLAYYPLQMLARFVSGLFLPQIAEARIEPAAFVAARERLSSNTILLGLAATTGFAIVGPIATVVLYGGEFAQPYQIVALLGVLQAVRFIRIWPTTVALGVGRSSIVMLNNLARLVAMPLGAVAVVYSKSLEAIIGSFIVGETLALLVALLLLRRVNAVRLRRESAGVLLYALTSAAAVATAWTLQAGRDWQALLLLALAICLTGFTLYAQRSTLVELVRQVRRRVGIRGLGRRG